MLSEALLGNSKQKIKRVMPLREREKEREKGREGKRKGEREGGYAFISEYGIREITSIFHT